MRLEELKSKYINYDVLYGCAEYGPETFFLLEGADVLSISDILEIESVLKNYRPTTCIDSYSGGITDYEYNDMGIMLVGRIAKVELSYKSTYYKTNKRKANESRVTSRKTTLYICRNNNEWYML